MTNHRRRMQTRTRNISTNRPWWSDPIEHNASVARRKELRTRARARRRMFLQVGRSLDQAVNELATRFKALAEVATAATAHVRNFGTAWSTLDQLAAQGWDVREDMDALATEEAEATRQENNR